MSFPLNKIAMSVAAVAMVGLSLNATADIKAKFSYAVSQSNPIGLAADRFIELVDQKSNGKMQVTGYPDAQLGNEIRSMSSAQGGIIELSVISTAGASGAVEELGIFDLPFLFKNVEEADAVVDSEVGQQLLDKFQENNLMGLCYWDYGFRQVSNSTHPIHSLEDFDGLKLRVLQNRIYIDTFKALGANPLALPYPETYTALETGAIDGQESAYLVTQSSGYHEIQDYMTETNHVYLPAVVIASKKFWDRLDADGQQMLIEACNESKLYHREVSRKMEEDVIQELVAAGMEVNTIEPEERARMVEATREVTEKYKAELGADLFDQTMAIIEEASQR
ncbi:MAG: TRAP transporter substrate-binding protein [Halomonas sp.]|uniref:TRAP transporter substrate-binding protein n=1 Tax=Halomonas sp. AOP42-C1-46 TaxID=3457671 RepID=UPI003FB75D01